MTKDTVPQPNATEALLDELRGEVSSLRALVVERLQVDEVKEEAFRRLYQDLELFRELVSGAQSKPVLLDIILLLDRVEKNLGDGCGALPDDPFVSSVRDELVEVLARRGVERLPVEDISFDPQRQRAIGTRPAPDQTAHNTVAEVIRPGYEREGQVLRATEVIVNRYEAS